MERTLNILIDNQHPIALLKLGGFMAQLEVYKLKSQIDKMLGESYRYMIFDLTSLVFIDSAGIGVLMHARTECSRLGGQLVLVKSSSSQVAQSLTSVMIHKVVEVFDTATLAADHLRQKYGLQPAAQAATPLPTPAMAEGLALHLGQIERRLQQMEQRMTEMEKKLENR